MLRSVEHRQSTYLNNRAENFHQPTCARERAMKKFTSARHAQRFLSAFSGISSHFRPGRHRLGAQEYRREMTGRFVTWNEVTGTATAANRPHRRSARPIQPCSCAQAVPAS